MRPALLPFLSMALSLALALPAAGAGPEAAWQAPGPGGLYYELAPGDGSGSAAAWQVQRRQPGGTPDPRYGERGAAAVSLGPDQEEPALLRVDTLGRAWVAGTSQEPDGQRAVVLRLGEGGLPDRRFGQNGRSSVAPAGHEVRVTELLLLDDGGALVAGYVLDTSEHERPAVWRLREDGSLDMRFAKGLWMDDGRGEAELASLQRAPDGSFGIGVRRLAEAQAQLDTWTWTEGGAPQRSATVAVGLPQAAALRLGWREGRWTWGDAAPAAAAAAPSPAADPSREAPAAAIATPFSTRAGASAAQPPADESQTASVGWWLLLPAGAGAMWWWRRRAAG